MKDAKGHGSDAHAAHQDATIHTIPTVAGINAMVERLRSGAKPDLSGVPQMPGWLRWFGKAARRERREQSNG
jgi:hypothetical protein